MDMVEILRGQLKQLGAAKTETEKEAVLEELKAFLISLTPEQCTDHLRAIGTIAREAKVELDAKRTSKLAA